MAEQSGQDPGRKGTAGHGDQAAQPGSASHGNEQPCDYNQRVVQRHSDGHRNEQPSGRIIGTRTEIYGRIERALQRDNVQPNDPMEQVVQGDNQPNDHSDNEQEIDHEEVRDEATTWCGLFFLIFVFGLCAAVCTAAAVRAGWVPFQYPIAHPEHSTIIAGIEGF